MRTVLLTVEFLERFAEFMKRLGDFPREPKTTKITKAVSRYLKIRAHP